MASVESKLGRSLDDIIKDSKEKPERSLGGSSKSDRPRGRGTSDRASTRSAGAPYNSSASRQSSRAPLGVRSGGVGKASSRSSAAPSVSLFDHDDRDAPESLNRYGLKTAEVGQQRRAGRSRDAPPGNPDGKWKHDLFDPKDDEAPRRGPGAPFAGSARTKLNVSNLDVQVTKGDLEELFMTCGEVVSAAVHYDRSDRPTGTGHVIFRDRRAAEQAVASYNGVKLDSKILRIDFDDSTEVKVLSSGRSVLFPTSNAAPAGPRVGGGGRVFERSMREVVPRRPMGDPPVSWRPVSGPPRGGGGRDRVGGAGGAMPRTRVRDGGGGGAGGSRRGGSGRLQGRVTSSEHDLDAELDTYMQE